VVACGSLPLIADAQLPVCRRQINPPGSALSSESMTGQALCAANGAA